MAQRRMEAALGSIFLPSNSVYAQLDNPTTSEDQIELDKSSVSYNDRRDRPATSLSPTRERERARSTSRAHDVNNDDDPFHSPMTSPKSIIHEIDMGARREASSRTAGDAIAAGSSRSGGRTPSRARTSHRLSESRSSPFIEEYSQYDPTNLLPSVTLPSTTAQRAAPPLDQSLSTYEPTATSSSLAMTNTRNIPSVGLALSGTSPGGTSLMGLLNGTSSSILPAHHGHHSSPFRVRVAESLREEDESGGMSLRSSRSGKDRKGKGKMTPSYHSNDLVSTSQTSHISDLPDIALSRADSAADHLRDDDDEEEDDDIDDAPPDFTTRVPLMSGSTSRRRTARPASNASSWSPSSRLDSRSRAAAAVAGFGTGSRQIGLAARERALWRWVNVDDLDSFLQQVYIYYVGKGIWAIGLSRLLNLLTVGWVILFSTFLMGCIDYSVLWESHHLSEVVVSKCISRFSGLTLLVTISFSLFYFWRVVRFGVGVRKLWEMHEFYTELLEVPENDIQAIPWDKIVLRLSDLCASHPSALSSRSSENGITSNPIRLDAHDVANRIMREENYLIALFNKGVLDLSIPVPAFVDNVTGGGMRWGTTMLTQTLEWNLSFCLVGFLFGRDGQVRRAFLLEKNRTELEEALRRRFILMGLMNAVFAPFIVLYLLMYSFFRYFEEYHKNPSSIGSRQFTPLAKWKFREFNELPHVYSQRLKLAYPLADAYVNQYPKARTTLISRFVAFLAGSFAAVLILFSLIDPDAFLHFEITPGRTVLFYIGLFGTVLAVARGMIPDENKIVNPAETMKELSAHTRYLPEQWKDKLHSSEVHAAFGQLFQMKIALFVKEILSVIVTPFVLWYTLPDCAGAIIDFFREFTVHVDGLGYVCSFAVFDFKREGEMRTARPVIRGREDAGANTGRAGGEWRQVQDLVTSLGDEPQLSRDASADTSLKI